MRGGFRWSSSGLKLENNNEFEENQNFGKKEIK
jgi:hypothetical protein